jgi:hypothetical protein
MTDRNNYNKGSPRRLKLSSETMALLSIYRDGVFDVHLDQPPEELRNRSGQVSKDELFKKALRAAIRNEFPYIDVDTRLNYYMRE